MIGGKGPRKPSVAPRSDATPTSGPESHREWDADALWCISSPEVPQRDWEYRDTEPQAEARATELVRRGRVKQATFYRVSVEGAA